MYNYCEKKMELIMKMLIDKNLWLYNLPNDIKRMLIGYLLCKPKDIHEFLELCDINTHHNLYYSHVSSYEYWHPSSQSKGLMENRSWIENIESREKTQDLYKFLSENIELYKHLWHKYISKQEPSQQLLQEITKNKLNKDKLNEDKNNVDMNEIYKMTFATAFNIYKNPANFKTEDYMSKYIDDFEIIKQNKQHIINLSKKINLTYLEIKKICNNILYIDQPFNYNHTIMHYAIINGNDNLVKAIIEWGCNVNLIDNNALYNSIKFEKLSIFDILLENGADPNVICDWRGYNLLSARPLSQEYILHKFIEKLLNIGINPNHTDKCKRTPLMHTICRMPELHYMNHYSCSRRKEAIEIIKLFVKYGANVNAQDINGNTALHLVIKKFKDSPRTITKIRKILQESNNLDISIKNNDGNLAIYNESSGFFNFYNWFNN